MTDSEREILMEVPQTLRSAITALDRAITDADAARRMLAATLQRLEGRLSD